MMSITNISNKSVAFNSILVAIACVFAYSLVVMFYTIARSSTSIYNIMPSSERREILLLNGFSIAYCVVVFSLLMAIVSSIAGALAGVLLKKLFLLFNPNKRFNTAILISSITAIVLLAILYFLLYMLLKERITFKYAETFLFWYVFPAFIFLVAVVAGGIKLNKQL